MRFGKGIRILATSFVMALPLAQAADFGAPVNEVVDAAALKGIKRVAVTSFTVQYVTSQVWDTSFTSGGTGHGVKGPGGSFVGTGIRQTAGRGGKGQRRRRHHQRFLHPAGVPLVLDDKFDHLAAGRCGSNVNDPMLTFAGKIKAGA
jgi:hypothetical protein